MKVIQLTPENFDATVEEAAGVLRKGGVIIYPTDTLYGLGADAFSDAAFEKVCMIKERDERRPVHAVFADMEMAGEYAELNEAGQKLARQFLPGPLTLIFKKKSGVTGGIARTLSTIGVRIPKNNFCLALAKTFGKPFTTTSANVTAKETGATIEEIQKQLGERASVIDLVVDAGELPESLPSTIVDLSGGQPFILREGAIPADIIGATLRV